MEEDGVLFYGTCMDATDDRQNNHKAAYGRGNDCVRGQRYTSGKFLKQVLAEYTHTHTHTLQ